MSSAHPRRSRFGVNRSAIFCYLNGRILPERTAAIPIHDRGFLFGEGVFTTIRVSAGEVEFFEEHLERVEAQCVLLKIPFPQIKINVLQDLIEQNQAHEGIWRLKIIVTTTTSLITMQPYTTNPTVHRLTIYPEPIQRPISNLKTLSYLDRFLIKRYAEERGCDDAIVRSPEGYILETAFSNIYWMENGELFTPSSNLPMLQGIMLQSILKKTSKVHEVKVREIPHSAQVYTCNCMTGSVRVESLCGDV